MVHPDTPEPAAGQAAHSSGAATARPEPLSHHILCAGRSGIAFARLAAAALGAGCPQPARAALRVFIHLDAIPEREARNAAAWLEEEPGVRVTCGLFGIRNPRKAINWHQRMINRVAELFAAEPRIAFVDADLFVTGPAWWNLAGAPAAPPPPRLYAQTLGLRKERRLTISGATFFGMKTVLFTLSPALHNALNTQRLNSDTAAARRLAREFPGAALETGKFVDTQVIPSLRAQALGYTVEDLSPGVEACHVGGFSHISAKKLLAGESTVARDNWLRRLRLFEAVVALLRERGWDCWLDPAHLRAVCAMRETVESEPALRAAFHSLKPSPDERAFARLALPPAAAPSGPPR